MLNAGAGGQVRVTSVQFTCMLYSSFRSWQLSDSWETECNATLAVEVFRLKKGIRYVAAQRQV